MEYRIALAQIAPRLGEVDANLELAAERLRRGGRRGGAELTVFPELALTGYLLQDLVPEVSMRADDPRLRRAQPQRAGDAGRRRLRRGDR